MRAFIRHSIVPSVVFIAFALVFYPVIRDATPSGEVFPSSNPEPYRRIDTGLGASVVRPDYWHETDPTLLSRYADREHFNTHVIKPIQYLRRRGGAGIFVRRYTEKPEIDTKIFAETTFKGMPAWEGLYIDSTNAIDYIPTHCIHVEGNGVWWTIGYWTTATMDELPDGPRRYLETVEFDTNPTASDNHAMDAEPPSQVVPSG